MSRATYDQAAVDWAKVVDAVRHAGGGGVTVPALDLQLILHGYRQLQTERAAALEVLGGWHRKALLTTTTVLDMQRALGVISEETYEYEKRTVCAAVDTTREGCVDHIPVASSACQECAQAQGVAQ